MNADEAFQLHAVKAGTARPFPVLVVQVNVKAGTCGLVHRTERTPKKKQYGRSLRDLDQHVRPGS